MFKAVSGDVVGVGVGRVFEVGVGDDKTSDAKFGICNETEKTKQKLNA